MSGWGWAAVAVLDVAAVLAAWRLIRGGRPGVADRLLEDWRASDRAYVQLHTSDPGPGVPFQRAQGGVIHPAGPLSWPAYGIHNGETITFVSSWDAPIGGDHIDDLCPRCGNPLD